MAKNEVKMSEECCLNCANLLVCEDILNYTCKGYEKSVRKGEITEKYNAQLIKIRGLTYDLVTAINNLFITDTEQAVAEKIQKETEPEKIAISKRNKDIAKLIEQGKNIKEIAEELDLKPETVGLEIEYLLKAGMIKAHPS